MLSAYASIDVSHNMLLNKLKYIMCARCNASISVLEKANARAPNLYSTRLGKAEKANIISSGQFIYSHLYWVW
jgi:hypothetical protein